MVQAFLQAVCLDDASGYPESQCIFFRKKSKNGVTGSSPVRTAEVQ